MPIGWIIGIIAFLLLITLPVSIKIVNEWERGVVLRLGKFIGLKGPGIRFILPYIDRLIKIDLRVVTMNVQKQEVITRDNVTTTVDAVVYFRVIRPDDAMMKVEDYMRATSLISQTTLRSILGQSELDDLLAHRDQLNAMLQKTIDEETDPWGIKVSAVEISSVELPQSMQRAMAAQAEAERERRAKIVHAEGEFQAAQKLAEAARVIAAEPQALQLRYLQTVSAIATERSNTILFPFPLDLITPLIGNLKK
jgi:regulator of protease activity HflC (stomatin/prohibitin superfamily)